MHDGAAAFSFELSGALAGEAARELNQAWRTASSVIGERALVVDLSYVTDIDPAGLELLRGWHEKGGQLVARSAHVRALLAPVTGHAADELARPAQHSTWRPYRIATVWPVILAMFLLPSPASAASLKGETIQAWEDFVKAADCRNQARLDSGKPFLTTDEVPGQAARLRAGKIVVSPADSRVPRPVPSGLIHDWIGAAFLPHTTLATVLTVIRDYPRYKDFYSPSVVDSRFGAREGSQDRFSLVLLNESVLSKVALDSDYRSSFTRLDDHHWYSVSEATRVQEIENYGSPIQRLRPVDAGTGFIWRMFSVTRFEERDGGVYIEIEAMALSRDVPASFRWLIEPVVRRISRSSLVTTLERTQMAVR